MSTNGNGDRRRHQRQGPLPDATRSASRSSASATAPRRSCRASSTTRTPTRNEPVPGLMHVDLGGYHVSDIEFTCAFDIDADEGRQGPRPGDLGRARTTRSSSPNVPTNLGVPVHRGMTHDGLGKYLKEKITKAPGETADIVADPQGDAHRRRRLLPAGRLRGGDQVVRRAGPRGRLRLRQLHPGVHRPRGLLGQALQEGRPADRRRRHQVARSARRSSTARSRACSTTAA